MPETAPVGVGLELDGGVELLGGVAEGAGDDDEEIGDVDGLRRVDVVEDVGVEDDEAGLFERLLEAEEFGALA